MIKCTVQYLAAWKATESSRIPRLVYSILRVKLNQAVFFAISESMLKLAMKRFNTEAKQ